MSDLIKRLRKERELAGRPITKSRLCCEAADALGLKDQRIELLRTTMRHARKKLEIYRDHSSGEYHGGIEHTSMIRMIDESLNVTETAGD